MNPTPPLFRAGQPIEAPPVVRQGLRSELADGLRLAGRLPVLASILGVTALTNFFHFAYFPIVPVVAKGVGRRLSGRGPSRRPPAWGWPLARS